MTQFPQLPPMGWYPDPSDPAKERYWDGAAWTHNTKPAEPRTAWPTPAVPQPQVLSAAQASAQPYQQPGNPYQPSAQQPSTQQPYPYGFAQQGFAQAGVGTVATTGDGVPLAGWWQRVGAYVLDMTLVGVVSLVLGWPYVSRIMAAYELFIRDSFAATEAAASGGAASLPIIRDYDIVNPTYGFQFVQMVVLLAYLLLCYGLLSGTLFQRAFGMRVVPTDKGLSPKLSWGQSASRALLFALVTLVPLLPYLSYLMPLWTSKKQTLHDMVAGTQVVKLR